jgi:hypothetical protein
MTTTLLRAERVLLDAQTRLLAFSGEVGEGKWNGRDHEAAMHINAISKDLHKATALMFASDGFDGPAPSIDIH